MGGAGPGSAALLSPGGDVGKKFGVVCAFNCGGVSLNAHRVNSTFVSSSTVHGSAAARSVLSLNVNVLSFC